MPHVIAFSLFFAVVPGRATSCFWCCAPLGAATFRRGQSKTKHHPGCLFLLRAGWCYFFCCGPSRTLTQSLWAGATPPAGPGWCFFFLLAPRPDAYSLTAGLGRDAPGQVVLFFLCCGPAEPGEPRTKHVRCTTSGLKRPGGAAATKRKHHFQLIHNVSLIEGLSLRLVTHMRHGCMNISLLPTLGCDCCAVATALHNHNPF